MVWAFEHTDVNKYIYLIPRKVVHLYHYLVVDVGRNTYPRVVVEHMYHYLSGVVLMYHY